MIFWIEPIDPVADLCLTNQIYSVLFNAFQFKEITEVQNAHFKMLLQDGKTRTRRCKTLRNAARRWKLKGDETRPRWLQVPDTTVRAC